MTAATTAVNNFICTDGTFEIREVQTDKVEIPAGQLSYDKNGNFLQLDTNLLYPDTEYKFVFRLNIKGETIHYDEKDEFTFKVV